MDILSGIVGEIVRTAGNDLARKASSTSTPKPAKSSKPAEPPETFADFAGEIITQETYSLFGKEYRPKLGLPSYNNARQFIRRKAAASKAEFAEKYRKFSGIEPLLADGENIYHKLILQAANGFVKMLNNADISAYDADGFLAFHDKKHANLRTFSAIIESLIAEYNEIIEEESKKDAERTERRQNRKRLNKGVFASNHDDDDDDDDFDDNEVLATANAVAGTVVAGAANAASGLAHGTFNIVSKIGSSVQANHKKSKMFGNPKLFPSLATAVYEDCLNLQVSFLDILEESGVATIRGISQEDSNQAKKIFEDFVAFEKLGEESNVENAENSGNLDDLSNSNNSNNSSNLANKAVVIEKMLEIIELDPYNPQYYCNFASLLNDENSEIEILARDFGYFAEIRKHKRELANSYFRKMAKADIAETVQSAAALDGYCQQLGNVSNIYAQKIDDHILRLAGNFFVHLANGAENLQIAENEPAEPIFAQKITAAANGFASIESCKTAAEKLAEYCEPLGEIPPILSTALANRLQECKIQAANNFLQNSMETAENTQNESVLLEIEENLLEYCEEIELAAENPVWSKLDRQIRTIENIEFATREQAHKAWHEKYAIEEIIAASGKLFRGDFLAVLAELNSGKFTTAIKQFYEKKYIRLLKEFDKKLENAKHYEEQQKTGKKFTGLKNIFRDVSSALGGKSGEIAWNELTQNGALDLGVVGSEEVSSGGNGDGLLVYNKSS
ncbi:MAG: hypothetical protein FWG64_02645 [Firmicutes bacterium]|nr:hypothetical protein [Bacillota bacterium]